jgi:NifU-like protein involved in Fe-S cluster formation
LLTEKEFLNAKSRAEKNPEDTFGDVIAFQVLENKVCNKITDVKKENFE